MPAALTLLQQGPAALVYNNVQLLQSCLWHLSCVPAAPLLALSMPATSVHATSLAA